MFYMERVYSPYQKMCLNLMGIVRWERRLQTEVELCFLTQPECTRTTLLLGKAANERSPRRASNLVHDGDERMQPTQPKSKVGRVNATKLVVLGRQGGAASEDEASKDMLNKLLKAIHWENNLCSFAKICTKSLSPLEKKSHQHPLSEGSKKGIQEILIFGYDIARALLNRGFDKPDVLKWQDPVKDYTQIKVIVLPALIDLHQNGSQKRMAWDVLKKTLTMT